MGSFEPPSTLLAGLAVVFIFQDRLALDGCTQEGVDEDLDLDNFEDASVWKGLLEDPEVMGTETGDREAFNKVQER